MASRVLHGLEAFVDVPVEMQAPQCRLRARSAENARAPSPARLNWEAEHWRRAFYQECNRCHVLEERCEVLEEELQTLQEVITQVDGGNGAPSRYVARIARENWRLARRLDEYLRVQEVGSGREQGRSHSPPSSECASTHSNARASIGSASSASNKRPKGMNRINLNELSTASPSSPGCLSSPASPLDLLAPLTPCALQTHDGDADDGSSTSSDELEEHTALVQGELNLRPIEQKGDHLSSLKADVLTVKSVGLLEEKAEFVSSLLKASEPVSSRVPPWGSPLIEKLLQSDADPASLVNDKMFGVLMLKHLSTDGAGVK